MGSAVTTDRHASVEATGATTTSWPVAERGRLRRTGLGGGGLRSRVSTLAERLGRLEPWLAPLCALTLLLYPNPLVLPAAALGSVPILARWLATGRPWPRTVFDLPLGLLVLGALLGAWGGLSREGTAIRLSGLLAGLLLYGAIRAHATTARRLRAVVVVFLVAVTLGTLALLVVVQPFLRLDRVPPLGALALALDAGGVVSGLSDQDALLQRYRLRASGVGALADIGLALVFAALIATRGRAGRLALALAAILFAAALLASDNRGSMLAGALTLGVLAGVWRPRLLPLIPLGGLAIVGLLSAGLVERGLSLRTVSQRFWFWDNSLYLARELPLTGAGLGTSSVQLTYTAYFLPVSPNFSHAHNIFLQGLLEQGVFGLLGLVGLSLATLWAGWRARRLVEPWRRAAALGGLGMALAWFGTGLSEISALTTVGGALLLAALALLAAAGHADDAGDLAARTAPRTVLTGHDTRGNAGSSFLRAAVPGLARVPGGPPLGRSSWRWRLAIGGVLVAALTVSSIPTGLGARALGLVLLNLGTVELNRATVSEEASRNRQAVALERAVQLLRTAEGLDARNATVQRNLALALAARDDARRARAAADRARANTPPSDRRGQFQLGRAYEAAGVWGEALRAWETAEAGPQLLQLGARLSRSRNWDQAVAAYRAVALMDPTSATPYEGIVRAARGRGDETEAIVAELQPLIARGDWNEYHARVQVARLYRQAGRPYAALESLRLSDRAHRGSELTPERGMALAQVGRFEEAERLLSGMAATTHDAETLYWLGLVRSRLGEHDDGIASARAGLARLEPGKLAERAQFLGLIGDSLLAAGRPSEAARIYEEGAALATGDRHLPDGLARARAALAGGPVNLLVNPGFEWEGGWLLVPPGEHGGADVRTAEEPAAGQRAGQITLGSAATYATQGVRALQPGETYRLTALVRTAGLYRGAATLRVAAPDVAPAAAPAVYARAETASLEWTELELTFQAPGPSLAIDVGFPDGGPPGAVAWVDEVRLSLVETGHQ